MQGYILKITPTKNEDLILKILTPQSLDTFYRFYGARHSTIGLGYKIDFEYKINPHFLPQPRNILHLSHIWEKKYERMYIWQRFIQLLEKHLNEIYEIEEFYYKLLESSALKLVLQNPKRVLLESYALLLAHEGRLRLDSKCFVCEEELDSQISLGRAFLLAHPKCVHSKTYAKTTILEFLQNANTFEFEDSQIDCLWDILCLGL